eukprot:m.23239 g.23239  ORF g.23239 m.23239 type:complete len:271 (-) comp7477_c0_seq1:39-851(-)
MRSWWAGLEAMEGLSVWMVTLLIISSLTESASEGANGTTASCSYVASTKFTLAKTCGLSGMCKEPKKCIDTIKQLDLSKLATKLDACKYEKLGTNLFLIQVLNRAVVCDGLSHVERNVGISDLPDIVHGFVIYANIQTSKCIRDCREDDGMGPDKFGPPLDEKDKQERNKTHTGFQQLDIAPDLWRCPQGETEYFQGTCRVDSTCSNYITALTRAQRFNLGNFLVFQSSSHRGRKENPVSRYNHFLGVILKYCARTTPQARSRMRQTVLD